MVRPFGAVKVFARAIWVGDSCAVGAAVAAPVGADRRAVAALPVVAGPPLGIGHPERGLPAEVAVGREA